MGAGQSRAKKNQKLSYAPVAGLNAPSLPAWASQPALNASGAGPSSAGQTRKTMQRPSLTLSSLPILGGSKDTRSFADRALQASQEQGRQAPQKPKRRLSFVKDSPPQPAAAGGREQPTSKERYADIRKAFNMFDTDGSGARRPHPRAENCAPAPRAALRARHPRGRRPRRVGSLRGARGRRGRRVCARARRARAAARRGGLFTEPCQLTRPPRARRRH